MTLRGSVCAVTMMAVVVLGLNSGATLAAKRPKKMGAGGTSEIQPSNLIPSDSRLMKDVADLGDAMEKAMKLRPVRFTDSRKDAAAPGSVGLVAQDLETVFPELVSTRPDGIKDIDYGRLSAVLVQAIKDQQKELTELRKLVCQLQHKAPMCVKARKQLEVDAQLQSKAPAPETDLASAAKPPAEGVTQVEEVSPAPAAPSEPPSEASK